MSWEEIREISNNGTEIGSHAMNHARFHGLTGSDLEYEMGNSRRVIEDETGKPVLSFAIPYAFPEYDERFATGYSDIARKSGYRGAVTTRIGVENHPDSLYLLRRIPVNEHDDERFFKAKIEGDYDWMGTIQAAKKYLFPAKTDAR
jgi:peptidoglycan/xylan/chitin deacetylase (PgdA/CDA1 family)